MARQPAPPGKKKLPRSFRVDETIWAAARARATREGTSVNSVIGDLIEGYARGVYELPSRRVVTEFPAK